MPSLSSERKKMTNVYILEILKRYTDDTNDAEGNPAHCLTQAQIGEKLRSDYGISLNRKAVARGLNDLTDSPDFTDRIVYDTERSELIVDGEAETVEKKTNFRYVHDFNSAQTRLLMDAVLFSNHIPASERRELLETIAGLGDVASRKRLPKHLGSLSFLSTDIVSNDQVMYNIGVIDEAIEQGRQISYTYNFFGKDKKLHPKRMDDKPVTRTVNPYSMLANNGRYYLICNYDRYDNITNVRIDKITDIEILKTPAKPKRKVSGFKDVPATLAEQLYMQPGRSQRVVFRADNCEEMISAIVDWFGQSVRIRDENKKYVICDVLTNPESMRFWAMQYSDSVEVIEPDFLRDRIKDSLLRSWKKYNGGETALNGSYAADLVTQLMCAWQQIAEDVRENRLEVKRLGNVVRKTHFLFLMPQIKEQFEACPDFILAFRDLLDRIDADASLNGRSVAALMHALLEEYDDGPECRTDRKIPDNILAVRLYSGINGALSRSMGIDVSVFEEDYLSLLQAAEIEMRLEQNTNPFDYHAEESIRYFREQRARKKEKKS